MSSTSTDQAAPTFSAPFNLCTYFLDHNLEEGRADKVAVRSDGREWTYGDVAKRVRALTAALRSHGLCAEERVLIVLPDGIEFVETWFATLRAGGVFAMVNPLQKQEAFEYYLEYTKARIVVTCASVLPQIAEPIARSRFCRSAFVVGEAPDDPRFFEYEQQLAGHAGDEERAVVEPTGPDDLAGWLFTSGSTGEPKACVHTHGDFAFSTETYALRVAGYQESDVCLSVPKLFFGYATGTNLMFPFRVGATVVLFPGRATADEMLDQIEAHRPTFVTAVPTLLGNMLRSERIDQVDLSTLRVCLSAGEALPQKVYEDWKARTGVEILDGIGSAEMFHIYISNRVGDVRLGSLGKLVPGYEAEIVDPRGKVLPDGEPGRLRVRGGSTALCYWGDKGKSNATFQGAWCTTADIFVRDAEGYFYYQGRDDDLLKVSGIWVSPLEVENALLLEHAAVAEVCVVGRADEGGLVKAHAIVHVRDAGFGGLRGAGRTSSSSTGSRTAWRRTSTRAELRVAQRSPCRRTTAGRSRASCCQVRNSGGLLFPAMNELGKLHLARSATTSSAPDVRGPPAGRKRPRPHGPHLPLDTDVTIAQAQARRAAERLDRGARRATPSCCRRCLRPDQLHRGLPGHASRSGRHPLEPPRGHRVESLEQQGVRRVSCSPTRTSSPAHVRRPSRRAARPRRARRRARLKLVLPRQHAPPLGRDAGGRVQERRVPRGSLRGEHRDGRRRGQRSAWIEERRALRAARDRLDREDAGRRVATFRGGRRLPGRLVRRPRGVPPPPRATDLIERLADDDPRDRCEETWPDLFNDERLRDTDHPGPVRPRRSGRHRLLPAHLRLRPRRLRGGLGGARRPRATTICSSSARSASRWCTPRSTSRCPCASEIDPTCESRASRSGARPSV